MPGFTAPAWAQERGDLPDLPRPLPQRPQATTTRRPATSATTTRCSSCRGAPARGLLPQLRRRRHELPVALRPDTARLEPDQGGPARPRLHGRRPEGRRPAARLPRSRSASRRSTSTRSSTRGSNHGYDTQDYTQGRPVLRHAEGLGEPRQARAGSAASGSSSTASSTTCRRTARSSTATTTIRRIGACESRRLALAELVRLPERGNVPVRRRRDYDGWFGFDSIPVLTEVEPGGAGVLPHRPGQRSRRALARSRAPAAGGWTSSGDPSFPTGYWEAFRRAVKAARPERADDQRDVAEGQRPCCASCAATGSTRR